MWEHIGTQLLAIRNLNNEGGRAHVHIIVRTWNSRLLFLFLNAPPLAKLGELHPPECVLTIFDLERPLAVRFLLTIFDLALCFLRIPKRLRLLAPKSEMIGIP